MWEYMKKLILIAAAAAALSGCVGESFSRQDYGDAWPFTVDQVSVGCDAMGLPYVEANNRTTYGLTGHAVQQGYPAVSPKWLEVGPPGCPVHGAMDVE